MTKLGYFPQNPENKKTSLIEPSPVRDFQTKIAVPDFPRPYLGLFCTIYHLLDGLELLIWKFSDVDKVTKSDHIRTSLVVN